ncbi:MULTISPECIES: hypothetical protein [unclassified Streptomyces]|uniref:hypothetical protein n=1 Tax=unclassified Streptomyces TaxID=2593676 RepID=UPI00093E7051|nr:hypothetical protein [Streptomyces sp. TSRI0281]OKI47108.1 hypothetical protein A6A29_26680 [Streptomyces sp. TSRI0281]
MTVQEHAVEVGAFAQYLRDLAARLDPGGGWYGVFTRRDPVGMRACLDGVEIPPWDVVESLLSDLAVSHGTAFAERASVRAAALYSASAAARDRQPGGRQALVHRLELMLRVQSRAAERMGAAAAGGPHAPDTDALAWARDDHERASARCTDLRQRMAAVAVPEGWFREEGDAGEDAARVPGPRPEPGAEHLPAPAGPAPSAAPSVTPATPATGPTAAPSPAPQAAPASAPGPAPGPAPTSALEPVSAPPPASAPGPAPRRKKPRGARFAGLEVDDEETGHAPSPVPVLPVPSAGAAAPRGARFGGAQDGNGPAPATAPVPETPPDPAALRVASTAVAQLVRLRAGGRSGEAHVVLCEAAAWPAGHLPVLALALHRAGLAADWATLLWEVSLLPPEGLAGAVGALAAAGRTEDCGQLLRLGVARPAADIAAAVVALDRAGRASEAQALLGAFVRVRTPQDAAGIAGGGRAHLVPRLLAAARQVSTESEWDLVHALRVAGVAGT